jgi:hypothetical protein
MLVCAAEVYTRMGEWRKKALKQRGSVFLERAIDLTFFFYYTP